MAPSANVHDRLRAICLGLPDVVEVVSHGESTFRYRDRQFAMNASADNHHGNGRPAAWIKAEPANQQFMVKARPDRFFVPPYVGPQGWIGMWLDRRVSWREVRELVTDGYRLIEARKKPNGARVPRPGPGRRTRPGS